jgi:hypothetical protein
MKRMVVLTALILVAVTGTTVVTSLVGTPQVVTTDSEDLAPLAARQETRCEFGLC